MRLKGWIYIILIVIFLVIWLIQSAVDTVAGCNQSLLDRFEKTRLAREYEIAYVEILIETENLSNSLTPPDKEWTIHKQGEGCVVDFSVSYFTGRRRTYTGDKFYIDLESLEIRPLTGGAELFMEASNVSNKLP